MRARPALWGEGIGNDPSYPAPLRIEYMVAAAPESTKSASHQIVAVRKSEFVRLGWKPCRIIGYRSVPTRYLLYILSMHDTLFLAMNDAEVLYFIVAPGGSTSERQLSWLFGLQPAGDRIISREVRDDGPELNFAACYILDEFGIDFEEPDADRLDGIIERFGMDFPGTAEFSDTARLTLPHVRAEDDPDAPLIAWLTHEEALFRGLERRVVSARPLTPIQCLGAAALVNLSMGHAQLQLG